MILIFLAEDISCSKYTRHNHPMLFKHDDQYRVIKVKQKSKFFVSQQRFPKLIRKSHGKATSVKYRFKHARNNRPSRSELLDFSRFEY